MSIYTYLLCLLAYLLASSAAIEICMNVQYLLLLTYEANE